MSDRAYFRSVRFLFLIISLTVSSPSNSSFHFLLGFEKEYIREVVNFDEDCFPEINRSVAVISSQAANSLVPFELGADGYIELEFSSCAESGVVISMSIPIQKKKYDSLIRLYNMKYGDANGNTARLTWSRGEISFSLVKLSRIRYSFILSSVN